MAVKLCLYSHIATTLTHQFGYPAMEIIAARHLIIRLLDEVYRQTGNNVDQVTSCMNQAFDALGQSRGLSANTLSNAQISFEHLTSTQPGRRSA